jgi:hypothetical protein
MEWQSPEPWAPAVSAVLVGTTRRRAAWAVLAVPVVMPAPSETAEQVALVAAVATATPTTLMAAPVVPAGLAAPL